MWNVLTTAKRCVFLSALLVAAGNWLLSQPPVAQATSVSWGASGNCNNWYPHGWAWTQWSGYPSNSSGYVHGNLQHWTGSGWQSYVQSSQTLYGGSEDATADDYYGTYSYGTGLWAEGSLHSGTMISGTQYASSNLNCG